MSNRLFIGGPWDGQCRNIIDSRRIEWNVRDEVPFAKRPMKAGLSLAQQGQLGTRSDTG